MSFYVKRTRVGGPVECWATRGGQREEHDLQTCSHFRLQVGWVGPIRSAAQAQREADAWNETGEWDALPFESTPIVRKAVHDWQREADRFHARKPA